MLLSSRSHRRPAPLVGLAAAALLAVALTACSGTSNGDSPSAVGASSASSTSPPVSVGAAATLQLQYQSVIKTVLPSVVEISTKAGLGSGIVFDDAGDIVTNDHVVGNAKGFQVRFADSPQAVAGTLVGTFAAGDLAVVKVAGREDLHPATFGNSDAIQLGTIVLAMGNPLGLASSVTNGIISAVGRTLTEPASGASPGTTLPGSIQTSAAINPGNSGGALVNMQGQVIGIPTLAAVDQQGGAAPGIGFAIPSNTVTDIASQLVKYGKVINSHRAALGVVVQTVADASGSPVGVGIVSVNAGGAAARAGLQPGDVITKIDGNDIAAVQALSAELADLKVGQTVPVAIERAGSGTTVQVTLEQLPASS